ncbi:MAG: WD40 repeat domain-containing protein, partial [bacterium]|nr:WD40 repeat domain-containing protein [bacterium]
MPDECVWQVLNCFVTVEGTNLPLEKEVLHERLHATEDILNDCLASLERTRILRLSENQKTYEIAHDALALRIDDKRSVEEKTLLKVERLVKDRFVAYGDTSAFLAKGELNYIEPYEKKLKSRLAVEEIDFLKKSKKHASKRRRNIIFGTAGIIVTLLFLVVFAGLQWKVAEERTKEANANYLASQAQLKVKENPTIALRIAEKAWRLDKNNTVNETIYKIYRENNFYKIVARHEKDVYSVAFSPDGKTILTGSWDNTARLSDLQGKTVQEFKGHKDYVNSVAFSPDGKTILTGSDDKSARLWDLQGKTVQEFKGHRESVSSVTFSPDGKTILTGSGDETARLWNLRGKTVQEFKGHKEFLYSVAFSPDGKTILTGSVDNTARLWDLHGKTLQEFKGHKDIVLSVAFSPDGKTILTGSMDNTARLWDLQGKTVQEFKGYKYQVISVAYSPDGKTILTGSGENDPSFLSFNTRDNTARLWDLQGKMLQEFKGHTEGVSSVAFSPDGKTILTGSWDETARLWDMKGKTVQEFKGHKTVVNSAAFSPDGKTILTGSWSYDYFRTGSLNETARLW